MGFPLLVPRPRSLTPLTGRFPIAWALEELLRSYTLGSIRSESRYPAGFKVQVAAERFSAMESYRLEVEPEGIRLTGADARGVLHGAMSLRQLVRQKDPQGRIPCCRIEDSPDFPNRGVVLDIARAGAGVRKPLAEDMENLIERYRALWLQRSRPGGLNDSAGRLERFLAIYRGQGVQ